MSRHFATEDLFSVDTFDTVSACSILCCWAGEAISNLLNASTIQYTIAESILMSFFCRCNRDSVDKNRLPIFALRVVIVSADSDTLVFLQPSQLCRVSE